MSEKEQQFERIYKETENFGRTQFVREIQMQINDNKKKDKEIERLKKDNEYLNKVNIELSTEKNRLNNIINELDTWLKEKVDSFKEDEYVSTNIEHERLAIKMVYYYLQELKGEDKE